MRLVDSHCHLERSDFPDVASVIARAQSAGLVRAVVIGQFERAGSFGTALAVASEFPEFLRPTMGIHPYDAAVAAEADWEELARIVSLPSIVAVGESGFDSNERQSSRVKQEEGFRRHCALAKAVGKPLVVHVRDLHEDCLRVLRDEGIHRGVIHCFTGDRAAADGYLAQGFHLSFSGVVTFAKTAELQQVATVAPQERVLVETDSPYLSPVPFRGQRPNEPARVAFTLRHIAALRNLDADELAEATTTNADQLFGLGPSPERPFEQNAIVRGRIL